MLIEENIFVLYIQRCNICASQYHAIYKVVHLCFLSMLHCRGFLMLLLASVKLSLHLCLLVAVDLVLGCWRELWACLVSGPRSSSVWTELLLGTLCCVLQLQDFEESLSGVSRHEESLSGVSRHEESLSGVSRHEESLSGVSRHVTRYLITLDWLLGPATHSGLSSLSLPVVSAVLSISLKSPMPVPRSTLHNDTKLYTLAYFLNFIFLLGKF